MKEFFKNLKNETLDIKLSHHEKQAMRLALHDAMKVPQPLALQPARIRAVRSTYVWFSPRFVMPVAVLLVLGLGTGTAFAAQGSLPGDVLYPVKINVTEPVEVALATTPAAKAQVEESLADRRVAEAQTLAAQGRLDATTTQELEDNFDEHASRALAFTQEESIATTSVTSSATTSVTTFASTSAETTSVPPRVGRKEYQAPRTGAFRFASTTPEATSSETETSVSSIQNAEDTMSASLQSQRNIFNELKQRVGTHGRGSYNTNNRGDQNGNRNGGGNEGNE